VRVLDLSGQATKGTWGMSWHQKHGRGSLRKARGS